MNFILPSDYRTTLHLWFRKNTKKGTYFRIDLKQQMKFFEVHWPGPYPLKRCRKGVCKQLPIDQFDPIHKHRDIEQAVKSFYLFLHKWSSIRDQNQWAAIPFCLGQRPTVKQPIDLCKRLSKCDILVSIPRSASIPSLPRCQIKSPYFSCVCRLIREGPAI